MSITRFLVLGIALVAGGVAAFLAFNLTNQPTVEAIGPVESVDTVEVLVANEDIAIGTALSSDLLTWRAWPQAGLSERFFDRQNQPDAMDSVGDAIARASFFEGEPITANKLIRSDSGFLSAILPAGKRAVATAIEADTSAGGFILPNDHVDVIMTRPNDAAVEGGIEFITETILHNVRVLAIDQTIEDQNGEQVVVGQTATLELTPDQAQILTVAQQLSERLTLALRSIADTNAPETDRDAYHLISGSKQNGAVTVVKSGVARDVGGIR